MITKIKKTKEAKKIKKVALGVLLSLSASSAFALNIIPSNSSYYYQMDGGSNFSLPPVTDQQSITIGGALAQQIFTCNGFNPAVTLVNGFNDLKDNLQAIGQSVVNNAQSMLFGMGLAKFAAIDPSGYSFLENAFKSLYDTFTLSEQTCQQTLNSLQDGKSPSQNWFAISDSQGWLNYSTANAQGQNVDITQASQNLATNPAAAGVPWFHQGENSGGTTGNQVPIEVIYDVVVAGYNIDVDTSRALDDQDPAPTNSSLAKYWATPDAAGKWANLVLGNISISSQKTQPGNQGGVGLATLLYGCPTAATNNLTCPNNIAQNIANIVQNEPVPQAADLAAISSYGLNVTPDVIDTIRNMPAEEQNITISKMSQDVAFQNLIDESLLLRQLLIAGMETQQVQNNQAAINTINQVLTNLQNDISNLKYEYDIRSEVTSNTLQKILEVQNGQQAGALVNQDKAQAPEMVNGAVYNSTPQQ